MPKLIVVTTPDPHDTKAIIEAAQQINPNADIVGRVHFKSDMRTLRFGTIPIVCDEEAAAEKMVEEIKLFNH